MTTFDAPQHHLSDIHFKCFALPRQPKDAMNEWTNESVNVGCWKILYNVLWMKIKLL